MHPVLARTFTVLVLLALLSLGCAYLAGAVAGWLLFSVGAVALLIHQVRNLHALLRWIGRADFRGVPGSFGAWDDAFVQLHRRERDHTRELQRLQRLLVRYRQASRVFPDSLVILDSGNRIQWCNDRAGIHLGIDSRADIKLPIINLVRQPEFVAYVTAGDFSRPLPLRTSQAYARLLLVQIIPFEDSQRLLIARDMTQAEQLDRVRRDFIANVSHELRTPLTVLVGFLETVRELKLDPQRTRDYLDMMAEQSKRMQRILEDLLMLSSLESAPEPPSDERIAVPQLLDRLRSDAEGLSAGLQRIHLEVRGNHDLLGAESEIASAFGNLVSNAIRYTPAGGEVRIMWFASDEEARFTVEDTGTGIAPEHIPRLTERFYRVDRGRSRDSGGTGLGLAIVKHALLRHQAELEIESTPGRGSRFTARFPARRLILADEKAQGVNV